MDLKRLIATRLNDHLDELGSFVDGLTDQQLQDRGPNGQLSLADITLHLAEVQEGYLAMLSQILLEDLPPLAPVPLDKHCTANAVQSDLRPRLKEFDNQRRSLVSLLNALADHHWRREGVHPTIPHYSLETCLEEMMRHEESHFYEMYQIFFGANGRE